MDLNYYYYYYYYYSVFLIFISQILTSILLNNLILK